MKKRVFSEMDNAVFRIMIDTEDWSEGDLDLMVQFGEPEINVGGAIQYAYEGEVKEKALGDEFVRILHGFPYSRGFDARDYDSYAEAVAVGTAWKDAVLGRMDSEIISMRSRGAVMPTEEVSNL